MFGLTEPLASFGLAGALGYVGLGELLGGLLGVFWLVFLAAMQREPAAISKIAIHDFFIGLPLV